VAESMGDYISSEKLEATIDQLEQQMKAAALDLEFEKAAELRDRIKQLKKAMLFEI